MQLIQDTPAFTNALGQESTETHRHVAKEWQRRCTPADEILRGLRERESFAEDLWISANQIKLDDDFRLNGMALTPFALAGLTRYTDCPAVMLSYLKGKGFSAQAASHINREIGRMGDRSFLMRTIQDGKGSPTVRAFCSNRYAILDNADALEIVLDSMPRGAMEDVLACHVDDDGDSFRAMLLSPDYIQSFPDSDFGVGLTVQNSEVGLVQFGLDSMSFRAICRNSCVHGKELHGSVSRKHQGSIDMDQLRLDVRKAVGLALNHGRDSVLTMQKLKTIGLANSEKMIVQLSREHGLDRDEAKGWHRGLGETLKEPTMNWEGTAYALFQGLTRSATYQKGVERSRIEAVASKIMAPTVPIESAVLNDYWIRLSERAESVTDKALASLIS